MVIEERYHPHVFTANQTRDLKGSGLGGFICVTAGTVTVTTFAGTVVINAFPVAAGTSYKLPVYLGLEGFTVAMAGGASGTVLTQ